MISRINLFNYGEVGERLSGIRESEIYKQSAQKIENFIINEIGNLKIAKKWETKIINKINGKISNIFDTKFDFYILTDDSNILSIRKSDLEILYKMPITTSYKKYKMVDNKLFIYGNSYDNVIVLEFDVDGRIGTSNFLDLIKLPVKDKEEVKIDVYKCYKLEGVENLRISLLGTYINPKLRSNNGIYLFNTNIRLERLYKQYKASITDNILSNATDGMVFGVLHGFYPNENEKQYIIGNTKVNLVSGGVDVKYGSEYFVKFDSNIDGELTYGKLINIKNFVQDVGMYSDRYFIINNGIFYFSKKGDYFDFRNDTKQDSAFFFKPNPINNMFPEIYSSEVGNKIYVTTSNGVYVISAGNIFSSTNYSVYVASEMPCKDKGVLIEDNFYFLNKDNILKCVQSVPNQIGYENFVTVDVEKYSISNNFDDIGKIKYDNRLMLVACNTIRTNQTNLYFYQNLEFNVFRRFSVTTENEFHNFNTMNKNLIFGNTFLRESNRNMRKALLKLNPPAITTEKGGNYSNDYQSNVERVFIKVLNEGNQAIKGIRINKSDISKIPQENDLFNCFRLDKQFPILNGYEIEVTTNEDNNIFEILGIDTKLKVASD